MDVFQAVKRSTTFDFTAVFKDDSNNAITGKAADMGCQLRDTNETLIATLTVTETETPGTYLFAAPDTSNWPVVEGELILGDIYYDGGSDTLSDTFGIQMIINQTHKEEL